MLKRSVYILLMMLFLFVMVPIQHSEAQEADVIRIGTLDLPVTLDPAMADTFMEWEVLRHLYVGLTQQVAGTNDYELALASQHDISENGLIHTFTIREDAVFNDGTPITADIFERSINRVMTLNEDGAFIMNGVVESVSASDAQSLVFTLEVPIPYFDALVSLPPFFAVHPDDFPVSRVNRDISSLIGNGVYTLDNWNAGGDITLTPNPNYQLGEAARNGGVVLQNYATTEDLSQALARGEIDVAWRDVLLTEAVTMAEENENINIEIVPSMRQWYLYFRYTDTLDDAEDYDNIVLREVVLRLLNRQAVVDSHFDGNLTPAYGYLPENVEGYIATVNEFEDEQEAEDILLENEFSPNRPVQVGFNTSRQAYGDYYGGVLSPMRITLSSVNRYVSVNISNFFVAADWVNLLSNGTGIATPVFAYTPVVMHPDAYLRPLMHSESSIVEGGNYSIRDVDLLLNQARATQDEAERNALYQEAQQIMHDEFTFSPLWQDELHVLYSSDVSGVMIEANFFLHYDLLEK